MAEEVPRASATVRRLRLEWLHRLVLEPRRLWRRYLLGNPLFMYYILRHKLGGRAKTLDVGGHRAGSRSF
jgi:UDP-N-acetyl-D-mannosaminuronic acid transferase (WecB/TagA/CpsF family)